MYRKPPFWEKGQGAVEYALGLSLIAVVLIVVLGALYSVMVDQFRDVICDGDMNVECTVGLPVASIQRTCNGLDCTFYGTDSTDSNGLIVNYEWDFGDSASGIGEIFDHSYSSDGTYTVTLTVTDDEGHTDSAAIAFSVSALNQPPTASFTVTCTELNCSFDATASDDDDGTIVSYTWDFGDGATGSGETTNHPYSSSGSRTVRLTVVDDYGSSVSTTRTATPTAPPASVGHIEDLNGTATIGSPTWTATVTITVQNALNAAVNGATVSGNFTNGGGLGNCTTDASGTCSVTSNPVSIATVNNLTFTVSGISGSVSYNAAANTETSVTISQIPNPPTASFTVDCSALVCTFNASASSEGDGGPIISYSWDFGDGSTGTGVNTSRNYASAGAGTYTVELTITDNSGETDTHSEFASPAENVPPTASFTVNCNALVCSVDAETSDDSDGSISTYSWNFGDGSTGSGETTSVTYAAPGTYTITLTVLDNSGANDSTTQDVSPTTTPSAVHISDLDANPTSSGSNWTTAVTIAVEDATNFAFNGATITGSFNNGGGSNLPCITVTGGTCTITSNPVARTGGSAVISMTFTVSSVTGSLTYDSSANTDPDGDSDGTTITVAAPGNAAPTASFTVSCANLVCSVNASASSDSDGTISTYSWNFGDGSTGTGVNTSRTYAAAGTFTITLTVTDNEGATGTTTRTANPSVANTAPTASFTVSCANLVCSVNASASSDSDGTISTYSWNFGDSSTGTGVTTSRTYAAAGTFTITLTVTDNLGATGTTTRTANPTAANVAPTASFTVSCANLVCTVDASASSDSDGSISTYSWNFGDSSTGSGMTASRTYAAAGTFTITLTVTDNQGATGTTTRTANPTNPGIVVHIADLAGSPTPDGGSNWIATITITVQNASNAAVNSATVTGSFNNGGGTNLTCITNASGTCTIASASVKKSGSGSVASFIFTVSNISGTLMTYNSAANVESSITVNKP